MDKKRPDPDQILKTVQAEESRRGKLKIFFGAVAGVGKTYAMLEAAKHRKKEGIDVIVGYVEAHKRAETEALLEGFEVLSLKIIPYKNIELREFDIDAALKRRPSLILVDELAHTNAEGSRHLKRWQDVEELLNEGIDVYTTLNVQHCESVNDVIAQVTNVVVRETVPDTFIEQAHEIELVDLPSEELLKRLKEGKVYLSSQADHAAEHFFQPGNLIALRQLALRYTAKNVDAKMRAYRQMHSISKVWNVGERFLLGVSSGPSAIKLIRTAKRIASEIGAAWTVAYVETPSFRSSSENIARVSDMLRFAEKLGAETVSLNGPDIGEELISYARSKNITKLIVGKPQRTRFQEIISGSVVNQLARKSGEIDLYIISGEKADISEKIKRDSLLKFSWKGMGFAILAVFLCTGVNHLLFSYLSLANLVMIYLLGVVWIAFNYGRRVSIIVSFLSVLCFDYFFVPPYLTFSVSDTQYLVTFTVMLTIGLLISELTERLRRQTVAMRLREERTSALYALTRDLSKTSNPDELYQLGVQHISDFFKCPVVALVRDVKKGLIVRAGNIESHILDSSERAVVEWCYEQKKIAGKGTDTLPGSLGLYLPLLGAERVVGVLGIFPKDEKQFLSPEAFHMFEMFANQTALAIEGTELSAAAIQSQSQFENERLRSLLLTTFSYDLPEQFLDISKAADELLRLKTSDDISKHRDLIQKIKDEAERLTNLAKELPGIIDSKS